MVTARATRPLRPSLRDASSAPRDANDITDATEPADPIENSEPADPTEPAEPIDPIEPTDRIEPSLATERIEPREPIDHRESIRNTVAMPDRSQLRADCDRCVALCCVAPSLAVSADFAIDKPAGVPCPNLTADDRCSIHATLRESGFPGCAAYDCFGAGQRVTAALEGGRRTRAAFAAFAGMRARHELLWYLADALTLDQAAELWDEVRTAAGRVEDGTAGADDVHDLLDRVAALARGGPPAADHRGADLIGRDLRSASLRRADLRGAYLIGADLRGVDLEAADLRGADLRSADVRDARLERALFLTRSQLGAAHGGSGTTLPSWLERPPHWLRAR